VGHCVCLRITVREKKSCSLHRPGVAGSLAGEGSRALILDLGLLVHRMGRGDGCNFNLTDTQHPPQSFINMPSLKKIYFHIIVVLGVHCDIYKSSYIKYILLDFTPPPSSFTPLLRIVFTGLLSPCTQ
jgi:hypothetical protein